MVIRTAVEADAEALLQLRTHLDHETAFMLMEPGERTQTVEETRQRITSGPSAGAETFVAEADGQLVGVLSISAGQVRRNRHSAGIVIGVRQAYAGRGIGTRLFEAMERWAREKGHHRLELTVMAHNERGLALYRKMGFEVEGTKRDSLYVDGRYVDEYYMAKLLS